jgi:hypothetical protein
MTPMEVCGGAWATRILCSNVQSHCSHAQNKENCTVQTMRQFFILKKSCSEKNQVSIIALISETKRAAKLKLKVMQVLPCKLK